MGIESFIKKVCVQTAIYWGNPVNDGMGGVKCNDPVEIKCRWTDKSRVISDSLGREIVAKGNLLLTQDVVPEGFVRLGSLSDYGSFDDISNPLNVAGAYQIIGFDKIPMIKSKTVFARTIYFGFGNV